MGINLPVARHKTVIALANDIIADGVNIDVEDIERIIDMYERVIVTSSSEGCDNTRIYDAYIDPYASIDFNSLSEEGIESLKGFVNNMFGLSLEEDIGAYINSPSLKTLNALIEGTNVVTAFKHVQNFMHFLGGMAEQFVDNTKYNTLVPFRFYSRSESGTFSLFAYAASMDKILYKYYNSTLVTRE